jgi:rubrerythrin
MYIGDSKAADYGQSRAQRRAKQFGAAAREFNSGGDNESNMVSNMIKEINNSKNKDGKNRENEITESLEYRSDEEEVEGEKFENEEIYPDFLESGYGETLEDKEEETEKNENREEDIEEEEYSLIGDD